MFGGAAMTMLSCGPACPEAWPDRFSPNDKTPNSGDEDRGGWDADDWDADDWDGDGGFKEGEPPEPQWALDASRQVLLERLASAATAPAGWDAAGVIEALSLLLSGPSTTRTSSTVEVGAAGLVDGIRTTQRLINHYQAIQQQWIAALARPGVAIPLDQLVDACQHPGGRVPGALRPPDEIPEDLPVDNQGEPVLTRLLDHPAWREPLADTAARLASAEVGCALRIAPCTARARVERALSMLDTLPATYAAHRAGDLDGYRVSIIADRTAVLTGSQRARVEQRVLSRAAERTPGVLRDQVDRAVISADPQAAVGRSERARSGRGVQLDKDLDDMTVFRATIGCADGQLAFGVLDEHARSLTAAGLADGRGTNQLRADIFTDLFRTLAETGHAHLTTRPSSRDDSPHTDARNGGDAASGGEGGSDGVGESRHGGDDRGGSGRRFGGVQPCPGHHPNSHDRSVAPPHGRAGTVAGYRRRTALNVYLDAATLAGLDQQPGELAGYGVITADTARALAASADTIRALILRPITTPIGTSAAAGVTEAFAAATAETSPVRPATGSAGPGSPQVEVHATNPVRSRVCGTILDAGRSVYRPPVAVLDYVAARDRTCTWPGCRAPGTRCDADHRHAFGAGGSTCACNLDWLCRFHHQVKTFTAWRAQPGLDGRLIWISPTGHRYPSEPGHPLLDHPTGTSTDPPDDDPPPF